MAFVRTTRSKGEPWVPLKAMQRAWQEYDDLRAAAVTLWKAEGLSAVPPVRRAGRRVRSLAPLLRPLDELIKWGLAASYEPLPEIVLDVSARKVVLGGGRVIPLRTEQSTRVLERLIHQVDQPVASDELHGFPEHRFVVGGPNKVARRLKKLLVGRIQSKGGVHGGGYVLLGPARVS